MNNTPEPTVEQLFDLSGKVALITGAAGYLGGALARTLAEAGARVCAASRVQARADQTAELLNAPDDPHTPRHFGVELDHQDEKSIERAIDRVIDQAGQIDILVNNANALVSSDWSNVTAEEFACGLGNATGYFLLARHVRNHAVKRGEPASVIMLGSMYGLVGSYPDVYHDLGPASPAAYHALKGGVIHLTRHLAVYWARDRVRVNCLSPGPFPRPTISPESIQRIEDKTPMRRIGSPHELKGALLLLASDAGSYITGHNLVVDGGWTAW